MTRTSIKISGMSCQHCVMGVKNALGTVEGITILDVQIGGADIEYRDASALHSAKQAIEEEGYQVVA